MSTTHAQVVFSDCWESYIPPLAHMDAVEVVDSTYPTFGIDEVRAVTTEAHRRPTSATTKVLIIRFPSITSEAQHAFLKTLEEPPFSTSIILVVPVGILLLDTIRSRVQIHTDTTAGSTTVFDVWKKLSYAERLEQIDKAAKSKDQTFFVAMSLGLRYYLASSRHTLTPATIETIHTVLILLRTRGASNKMLLEELALSVPVS